MKNFIYFIKNLSISSLFVYLFFVFAAYIFQYQNPFIIFEWADIGKGIFLVVLAITIIISWISVYDK